MVYDMSYTCTAQTCITRNTPIASPPSDVRYLTTPDGARLVVWCDHVTGDLIYQSPDTHSLAVVKDGCPIS
jgi:hypothetical protein